MSYGYSGALLTSMTTTVGAVSLDFDNDFRVATETAAGTPIAFGYDSDGLLTSAGALTLTRDAQNGLLAGTALGVVSDAWTYNGFGEPLNYSVPSQFAQQYTRDDGGRITQKVETILTETHTYSYGYDAAGRLATATRDGVTKTYSYDDNSNRLPGTYDAQDRLLSTPSASYTYTANGELATKTDLNGTTSYTYDELGNLLHVALPNGPAIDYVIDGQNRRVGKKVNSVLTQQWIYADQLRIVSEITPTVTTRFVYASRSNVPDYMIRAGVTYRIISDHLGSPRLVFDASTGALFERIDYDEWGNVIVDSAPGFIPFGFAGGLYDRDTGLVRFGARDYDPGVGRWTTEDPIGFGGHQLNLYGYVSADPVDGIDPDGTQEICVMGRMPFVFRAPVEVAESQAAKGLPRATPPYIPRLIPPEQGGPIPPGPVEPVPTPWEQLTTFQKIVKVLGKEQEFVDEVWKHITKALGGAGSEAGAAPKPRSSPCGCPRDWEI